MTRFPRFDFGNSILRMDCRREWMYFRARFYDPTTGEFISQDPLEYVDGMSLYRGYFSVIGVDPFGLRYSNCSTFEVISGPLDDGSMGLNCVFSCNCPNGSKWSEEITVPWAKIYKIKGPDWAGSKSGKQICDVAAKLPFILNKGFQNCRRGNDRPPQEPVPVVDPVREPVREPACRKIPDIPFIPIPPGVAPGVVPAGPTTPPPATPGWWPPRLPIPSFGFPVLPIFPDFLRPDFDWNPGGPLPMA